jgi:YVTN family beta-propeller protein
MNRVRRLVAFLLAAVAAGAITVGSSPGRDAAATSSYAFVPDSENDQVVVLNASLTEITRINVGNEPVGIDWSPDGSTVYVASRDGQLAVIDATTYAVTMHTVNAGTYLLGVNVIPDGRYVFIGANAFFVDDAGVWRFDTLTNTSTRVIGGSGVWDTEFSPDGSILYVARSFESKIQAYDVATFTLLNEITLPGSEPTDIVLNRAGTVAFVPHGSPSPGDYDVYVLDLPSLTLIAQVPAGRSPTQAALTACEERLYVSNYEGNTVTAIDLTSGYPVTSYAPIAATDPSYVFSLSIDPADGAILLAQDSPNAVIRVTISGLSFTTATATFSGGSTGQVARGNFFAPQPAPDCGDDDSDGDGIPDDEDEGPASNLAATVVIGGTDTGVPNTVLATGCSIADLIAQAAAQATNHGQFVSAVAHLTNTLRRQGIITNAQRTAIRRAAAHANIP